MDKFYLGEWLVDATVNQIENGDRLVHLPPKQMQVLVELARQQGEVVTRQNLAGLVWPERPVSDQVISRTVASLRKALGDHSKNPQYIATIPKVGYRLIVEHANRAHSTSNVLNNTHNNRGWLAVVALALLIAAISIFVAMQPLGDTLTFSQISEARPVATPPGMKSYVSLSPDGHEMVFEHWRSPSNSGLMLMHNGLEVAEPIYDELPGRKFSPAWSPDGREIAFGRRSPDGGCSIEIAKAAGGPSETVTHCGPEPAPVDWSPDGQWIAFSDIHSEQMQAYRIYLVSRDGRQRKLLVDSDDPGISMWAPRYSPDGRYIAFIQGSLLHAELMMVNADGSGLRQLGVSGFGSIFGLDWRADSPTLVYSYPSEFGTYTLWQLDVESGQAPQRLFDIELGYIHLMTPNISSESDRLAYIQWQTETSFWSLPTSAVNQPLSRLPGFNGFDNKPAWSNLGDQLAYLTGRNGRSEIRLTDRQFESQQVLAASDSGQIYHFFWYPDDSKLAYLEFSGGLSYLKTVSLANRDQQTLLETTSRLADLAWMNDRFYLTSDTDGLWGLYTFNPIGNGLERLTDQEAFIFKLAPDGNAIYYLKAEQQGIWKLSLESGVVERIVEDFDWDSRNRWVVDERGLILPCPPGSDLQGLCHQGFDGQLELIHPLRQHLFISGMNRSQSGKLTLSMTDAIESTIMATPAR